MHVFQRSVLVWPAALILLAVFPAAGFAADLTVRASERFTVPVRVHGHLLRLQVDPETPGFVVVNLGTARRIGLRPSLLKSVSVIGPVRLEVQTKVARLELAGQVFPRRFAWMTRNVIDDADGLISPASLPFDRVIYVLGPARPNEVTASFQTRYTTEFGLQFPMRVGDRQIRVQFSGNKVRSMATAAAGAQIAAALGGEWAGAPFRSLIEHGVTRPVREMALQRPLLVGGIQLRRFLVRTGDHLGNNVLPSDLSDDPREVVVTGTRRRQSADYGLTFGLDRLSACSRMVYERRTQLLTLSCQPHPI